MRPPPRKIKAGQKPGFFFGGEQGNSLPCVRESSWERCFALRKTDRNRRPGRRALRSPWGLLSTSQWQLLPSL